MQDQITDQQRLFAEAIALGKTGEEAIEASGYKSRGKAARVQAARLLANDSVAEYLSELRKEASSKASLTRDEIIEDFISIWKSKPSDASVENPLCEMRMSKQGPYAAFPSKMDAAKELAKMLAWYEPERHEHKTTVIIGGDAEK